MPNEKLYEKKKNEVKWKWEWHSTSKQEWKEEKSTFCVSAWTIRDTAVRRSQNEQWNINEMWAH